jgi:HK97 family phage major capsid protein
VAEGASITSSQASLAAIGLGARKLGALVHTSSELEEDAAVALGDWLADEMGAAFAQAEDAAAFVGDGSSTYGGFAGVCPQILSTAGASKVTAATGHDTFLELDATDFTKLISALPAAAVPGARWFISAYGWANSMLRLQGVSGDQAALTDADGRIRPRFMGFPVHLVQSMPAVGTDISGQVMCVFGDMRRAAMLGETREFTLARSDAGPTFPADQVAFKGTERVAVNVHDLGDTTTAGSIVGLVGE